MKPVQIPQFYAVGLVLFAIPFTRAYFPILTPLTLLLSYVVLFAQASKWDLKGVLLLLGIAVLTFGVEAVGVHTGAIFGSYAYGSGLGPKMWDTPLIIGLNWAYLAYATHGMASMWIRMPFLRVVLAALMMVGYDLIVEAVAPLMDMWQFDSGYPPFQNFVAWFVLALFCVGLLEYAGVKTRNRLSSWFLLTQLVFFAAIYLIYIAFVL